MNPTVMQKTFLFVFFCWSTAIGLAQGNTQQPLFAYDYDRCETHAFGGWNTISLRFQEAGKVSLDIDDYVIKKEYANQIAYEQEITRIDASGGSIMEKLDARAQMYVNTELSTDGTFVTENGYLKLSLENDQILGTADLMCELGGRYLMCGDINFVLAHDEVILDYDVISIKNVVHDPLTFQQEPADRWIVHINSDHLTLENGETFQLESLYNRGQYLGHGRDGILGLRPMDEQGISYDFRLFDEYGEGTVKALDDLKMKPAYFFGEYFYLVGAEEESGHVRISKQYGDEEHLWYVESAMCDIADDLIRRQVGGR